LNMLAELRDIGNTILVVEHDEETMRFADHIVDLGPGGGRLGGEIVAEGTLADIVNTPGSITGKYLSGEMRIDRPPIPAQRERQPSDRQGREAQQSAKPDGAISIGEIDLRDGSFRVGQIFACRGHTL